MAPTTFDPWDANSYILSCSGRPALPSAAVNSKGALDMLSRWLPPFIELWLRGVGACVRGLVHVLPLVLEVAYICPPSPMAGGMSAACGLSALWTDVY